MLIETIFFLAVRKMNYLFVVAFLLVALRHAGCVRITRLYVPRRASHEASLDCRYDLGGVELYDVKWYKDDQQFFRCLPGADTQKYPVEGVIELQVGSIRLGSCSLVITGLSPKSAGEYRCEVNTEGPPFASDSKSEKMKFVEPSPQTQVDSDEYVEELPVTAAPASNGNAKKNFRILPELLIYFLIVYL